MDPSAVVHRQTTQAEAVDLDKPRQLTDFLETSFSVSETQVALRKEELLRLLIGGKRTREAAEILKMSVATVRTYIKCPEFQKSLWNADKGLWAKIDQELEASKLSSTLRIREMSEEALDRIQALMSSSDESIVFRAASDVLDRNPETSKHSKEDRTDVKIVINPQQLMLAAQAAREMEDRARGLTIDSDTSS